MRSFEPLPNIRIVLSVKLILEVLRFDTSETLIPVENSSSITTMFRRVSLFSSLEEIKDSKNPISRGRLRPNAKVLHWHNAGSYTTANTSEHSCSEAFLCPNTAFYGGIRAFFLCLKIL